MPNLQLIAELTGHEDRVWQLSWDPAGRRLASCSGDKSVRIWSSSSSSSSQDASAQWICTDIIDNAHKRTVRSVAFEPTQGKQLATASFDGTTAIWEKTSDEYECIATLEGHENEAKSVAWNRDGTLLATCGRDKSVWIWEANGEGDFDCISVLMEHTQDVKMVVWEPTKGKMLGSFSYDNTVRLWCEDDDDWYTAEQLGGHESTVWAGAFHPDGGWLATVSDDRTLRVWQGGEHKKEGDGFYERAEVKFRERAVVPDTVHRRAIYTVSWRPHQGDLGLIATGGADNCLRIFRVTEETGINVDLDTQRENPHGLTDINCVVWNPRHPEILASAGDDGVVRIWRYI